MYDMNEIPYWRKPEYVAARKIYMKRWYKKNKEAQGKKQKIYSKLYPEVHRAASRRYAAKHRKSKTEESLKDTATWLGRKAELHALKILPGAKDMNSPLMNNAGYDIEWNGEKIDVKSDKLFYMKRFGKRTGWKTYPQFSFHPKAKSGHACTSYLCIGYKDDKVVCAYLIPSEKYSKGGITIGCPSKKWKSYEIQT